MNQAQQAADFTLVRNAKVEVTKVIDAKKHNVAEIVVNDRFKHRFSPKSRISKHLDMMSPKDLGQRLSGGSFFFIDDNLVDLRDGHYNGFVHTDDSISAFMEKLGFQSRANLAFSHARRNSSRDSDASDDIVLRKQWSTSDIVVPGYAQGGEFKSQLSFVWNPFVKTINSSLDIVRLICENGMVGLTSFLNSKIPLMNRWNEHLDIASQQIQNRVESIVTERVQGMSLERASVGDCLLLTQHAFDRMYSPNVKNQGERDRLTALMAAVDPRTHLSSVYKEAVFVDKNMAAQVPAHLTNFDVWNVATEMRSHTSQSKQSSDNALDKFANGILFERDSNFATANAARLTEPKLSAFSSPERAFFGQMH